MWEIIVKTLVGVPYKFYNFIESFGIGEFFLKFTKAV